MAGSVNKTILVGNLGKDPEITTPQEGTKIAKFSLATSETWNDKTSGERRERTEWHRIVVFNDRMADVVERFLKKGSKVYVEGKLATRKWTDQQGVERYTTEIVVDRFANASQLVMLDTASSSRGDGAGQGDIGIGTSGSGGRPRGRSVHAGAGSDLDDAIPFGPEWR